LTDTTKLPLSDGTLSRKLKKDFGLDAGYNAIWKKFADGVIELRRDPGRRVGLHATPDDLPIIAAALGYVPPKGDPETV
jgi:hypothetical protein